MEWGGVGWSGVLGGHVSYRINIKNSKCRHLDAKERWYASEPAKVTRFGRTVLLMLGAAPGFAYFCCSCYGLGYCFYGGFLLV